MEKDSYYDLVYYITSKIPEGRVSTYGAIADYLTLGSARMVGWALTQCNNRGVENIPAHRVVNRKGARQTQHEHHLKPRVNLRPARALARPPEGAVSGPQCCHPGSQGRGPRSPCGGR